MKGIILAGGKGTRLQPATFAINKHMVPLLNRPMIEFPIDTLKSFGVRDILIVTGGNHVGAFAEYLGNGSKHGVNLTYRVQEEAGGIAEALGLAEDFASGQDVLTILGDNIFSNSQFVPMLFENDMAHLFLSVVRDPHRFGVAELATDGRIIGIEEKPINPKSQFAVTGLYHYPNDVFSIVPTLRPSARGELEISDINNYYIKSGKIGRTILEVYWKDAGTVDSLHEASEWYYKSLDKQTALV